MGHEVIIYGRIEGAHWRDGEDFARTFQLNREALDLLTADDQYPPLVRGMFAMPAPFPSGTYRSQVIHFGASFKDEPQDESLWDGVFLGKFESFLRTLYWFSAALHLKTEFAEPRTYHWTPTQTSYTGLFDDPPMPVSDWERLVEMPRTAR